MPTPADVISGETIESEWGNTIRDFACFGIEMGGASDIVLDGSITTAFENGANVTFTKPDDWIQYKVMAWGSVLFSLGPSPAGQGSARILIGATTGTAIPTTVNPTTDTDTQLVAARGLVTGLSADATVAIQYNEVAAAVSKVSSVVSFIAIRTS